jgi:aminoglycoside phosphotransferase (APT) family kinase protein/deoxycytidylate deaminase
MDMPTLYEISSEEAERVCRILRSEDLCYEVAWIKSFFRLFGNQNYRVQFKEPNVPSLVVRIFQSRERYRTETTALRAVSANTDIPVPQIVAQSSNTEANLHYIITWYIAGGRLQENLPLLGDCEQIAIGQQLGEFLAQLHGLKKDAYGDLILSKDQDEASVITEADYTLQMLRNLLSEAQSRGVLEPAEINSVQTFIDQSAGLLTEMIPSLIHGDMIDANLLIDSTGKSVVITGVLDFEHSRAWSPEVDFTKILDIRFREYPLLSERFLDAYFHNAGIMGADARERFYSRLKLFQLIADLQLAVDLAKGSVGFSTKLLMGTRHLPFFQYQRLFALINSLAEPTMQNQPGQEDLRYLAFARKIAARSARDLPVRHGAVLVAGKDIRSIGFDEVISGGDQPAKSGSRVDPNTAFNYISAEVSTLLHALREEQNIRGATVFCTGCPDPFAASLLARSGIARVVFFGKAGVDCAASLEILSNQHIEIKVIDSDGGEGVVF